MLSTEVERIKNELGDFNMKLLYNMTMEEFINQLLENYNSTVRFAKTSSLMNRMKK